MSEVMERDGHVKHKLIDDWQAELNAAAARLVAMRLAMAKAEASHTAAEHARDRAASGGDVADAEQAQLRLEAATRALVIAQRRFAAAAAEVTRLNERRQTVAGVAHAPGYEDCMRVWQDEVAGLEADIAALSRRRARIEANFVRFRQYIAAGCFDIYGLTDGPTHPETTRDLRAHFEARRISWDDPKHPIVLPVELSPEEAHEQGLVRMAKDGAVIYVSPLTLDNHVAAGWRQI